MPSESPASPPGALLGHRKNSMPPPESSVPSRENRPPLREIGRPPDGSRRCIPPEGFPPARRQAAPRALHVLGWTTAFKRARGLLASSKTILARAALSILPSRSLGPDRRPRARPSRRGARTSQATSVGPHSASAAAAVDCEPIPPASVTMNIGFSARRRGRRQNRRRPATSRP